MSRLPPDYRVIPFHRPSMGAAERQGALDVLDSGWLTTGSRCVAFEEAFAAYLGIRYAVAVNSATAALHLALDGVGPGAEVIVPTYTFTACGEVVGHLGAKLVLVDVGEDYLIDPTAVARATTSRTRALMPVHFAGQVVDVEELRRVVGPDMRIVEDAAHALPASLRGRRAGTMGDAAAFSFYATKTMTTGGEGGMLVTNDERLADRARVMRLHGISADAFARYGPGNHWRYEVQDAGFKYNMTDIAAAIGLAQLSRVDEMAAKRERIAARYRLGFAGRDDIRQPASTDGHAWHLYVIQVDETVRDRVIDDLAAKGIGASVHFIPLHLHPYYRRLGYRPGDFPVAERLFRESISLPIWPDMSDDQVDRVVEAIIDATNGSGPARIPVAAGHETDWWENFG